MKKVSNLVESYLGDSKIYPVIGNHDTYPMDMFKFKNPGETPLVNEWNQNWNQFITDPAAMQTFL